MSKVSLKDFILHGTFGEISLGMPRQTVENLSGGFDDWWDAGHEMGIGSCGTLEFHFNNDLLFLIWCDNLSYLKSGKMKFDPWFLKLSKKKPVNNNISFAEIAKRLIKAEADFTLKHNEYNYVITIEKSGVLLYFEGKKRKNFKLIAFGKNHGGEV